MKPRLLPFSSCWTRWKSTTMCSLSTPIWMCRPTSWSASANASRDGLLVLGVDPGLADTGYGAVRRLNGRLALITCGTVKTPANLAEPQRLRVLAEQLRALLAELHPQAAAFEELFFSKNVRTAMAVGQARGVALLSAVEAGADVHDSTPNQVKLSVTGYGGATKGQMLKMVQSRSEERRVGKECRTGWSRCH